MGCGTARRGIPQKAEGGTPKSQCKAAEQLKLPKPGDATNITNNLSTIQGSFLDLNESSSGNKCLLCLSPNPQKVHTLDCGHHICMGCTKEQLEAQMRTKSGVNISYFCKVCSAPKNLSTGRYLPRRDRVADVRLRGRHPPARQVHPHRGLSRQDRSFRSQG